MADAAVSQQLTPTGKLRVAIAIAPAPSAQFAIKDEATGVCRGVAARYLTPEPQVSLGLLHNPSVWRLS